MRKILITTPALLALISPAFLGAVTQASFAENSSTQIGRYSTVQNKPTAAQINPLLAVAEYKFPPSVKTVGGAIHMVLTNTSYSLVPKNSLSKAAYETLAKPLPMTNRTLGPLKVKAVLTILMGDEVFNLIVDPLHREINFEVKPRIAKALRLDSSRTKKQVSRTRHEHYKNTSSQRRVSRGHINALAQGRGEHRDHKIHR